MIAGPLVSRSGAPISAAMIIASVVLPEAGRAGEQHVVGGAAAAPGGLEHQAELVAHPVLADHLVEGARPQRRLDDPLVALGLGGGQRAEVASSAATRCAS